MKKWLHTWGATAGAALLILAAFVAGWVAPGGSAYNVLMIAAAVVAGYPVAAGAIRALTAKVASIELLVTIAAVGALILGNYWEAAAVTFLFAFGGALENLTLARTRSALGTLVDAAPDTAVVVRDGKQQTIDTYDVVIGDHVLVKPGASIPVDGIVEHGTGTAIEAMITGESIPSAKQAGDPVYAGTVLASGVLTVRATGVGESTTLARIVTRVEEAQDAKLPAARFIDRFSRWYTPVVVVVAAIAWILTGNPTLALTLLVIACPGALVIAIPVSVVAGTGRGARDGVLIKGGQYLELAATVDTVAFDKTGTLTAGVPSVVAIESEDPARTIALAAVAEAGSEHPLAQPILAAAQQAGFTPGLPGEVEPVPGEGIIVVAEGLTIGVGNRALVAHMGAEIPSVLDGASASFESRGATPVFVVADGTVMGVIGIADAERPEAKEALASLRSRGIKTVMLTGDVNGVARTVAGRLGIDDYRAGLLPEDKLEAVSALQRGGHTVAMVGDGVNDAPALATADVGVAMGSAGTAVAVDTADIALMSDNLNRLPEAFKLARRTVRTMRVNVVLAIAVVLLLLVGVLLGGVTMAIGMLVHELSILAVIGNSMLLLRPVRNVAREHRAQAAGHGGNDATFGGSLPGDANVDEAGLGLRRVGDI